jgi:hypothetical protein
MLMKASTSGPSLAALLTLSTTFVNDCVRMQSTTKSAGAGIAINLSKVAQLLHHSSTSDLRNA